MIRLLTSFKDTIEDEAPSSGSELILRNKEGTVIPLKDSAGGAFLQERAFRGLEVRAGMDAPSILEQGRSGVARKYAEDDHELT
jgi:diphthamide biosynthesis protein 2